MIFAKNSDIIRYFLDIVIFYCANTTAFPMSDWKISESIGGIELQMGCCLKNVEKPLDLG